MGSTIGSVLQGIGQTGNEAATGDIAAVNQHHQFVMDYLANQARTRGLDLSEAGQAQALKIAQSSQDIERQRLEQSRWQLMPGYSPVPDPANPGGKLYRHTFVDPINGQQRYFDSDQPPPGSPEYQMNSFKFMRETAKEMGIDLPINTLISMAGMKTDTPDAVSDKNQVYWQQLNAAAKDNPAAMAALKKSYPGGYVDFFNQMIRGQYPGFSNEDWNRYVMQQGLTKGGNERTPQVNNALRKTYAMAQTAYEKQLSDAENNITKMGIFARHFYPDDYAAAVKARSEAQTNLDNIKAEIQNLNNSEATPPEKGPTVSVPKASAAAPQSSDAAATKLGLTHKWTDPKTGAVVGYSHEDGTGYTSVEHIK